MAAPKRNRSKPDDPCFKRTREKIRTTQLLNRLQDNALGKIDPPLTQGEITSLISLIDRVLPKLTSVTLAGDDEKPFVITEIKRTIID